MHGLDPFEGDDDGTVFRDVIMLALLGFVTIVVLLLPHLNPPVKAKEAAEPPGTIVVEVRWPDESNADVDLWVEAPGDVSVGYSNKGGRVFNLLRDDLGQIDDASGLNYEMAFSRGMPAGEYTVNLHLYANRDGVQPVPAKVRIGIKRSADSNLTEIARADIELARVGQEITVARFRLDASGALVPGSLHDLQRPLRAASH